mmetsp:Transcript_133393/g.217189  ORF Transcript_133393/g.217189 Transcript_133393/m.217189 type:complete len:204 (+) Transcript_133393:31-642(+)
MQLQHHRLIQLQHISELRTCTDVAEAMKKKNSAQRHEVVEAEAAGPFSCCRSLNNPRLTQRMSLKADFLELGHVKQVSPVKEEGWLHHCLIECLIVVLLELFPLGEDDNRMGARNGFVWTGGPFELLFSDLHTMDLHLLYCTFPRDLGVVHMDHGAILHQHVTDCERGCLTDIARILLEGKAKNCNLLVRDCVEHGVDDARRE